MIYDQVETCRTIMALVRRHRFDLSDEKRLQADLESVLTLSGFPFVREKRLSARDIPDFLVLDSVAVECKLRGARKMDVYRQLVRYSEHDTVQALIFVSNVSMGLPKEINGKPLYSAQLSQGWL